MIQMVNVSKTFPNQISALSDVTLEISPGEFAFITGPSGSGKTTLLRILFGAERPTSGHVIVNGIRLDSRGSPRLHHLRRTMGIVFQDARLLQDRTVGENVALALEVTGHLGRTARSKASGVLSEVGLQHREKDSILSLSAGEQQRVALARAIVNQPALLLVDEPTGNLDVEMTIGVMEIFGRLHEKGTTVVFATHDAHLTQLFPYRRIELRAGRSVHAGGMAAANAEA